MLSALVGFMLFCAVVILLPILLVMVLFKVAVAVLVIPFRLAAGLLHVFAGIGAVIGSILLTLFLLVMLPLAPLVLVVGLIWLVLRLFRSPKAVVHTT